MGAEQPVSDRNEDQMSEPGGTAHLGRFRERLRERMAAAREDCLLALEKLLPLEDPALVRATMPRPRLGVDAARVGPAYLEAAKHYARAHETVLLLEELWEELFPHVEAPGRAEHRLSHRQVVTRFLAQSPLNVEMSAGGRHAMAPWGQGEASVSAAATDADDTAERAPAGS
jgi:hypothetical protein